MRNPSLAARCPPTVEKNRGRRNRGGVMGIAALHPFYELLDSLVLAMTAKNVGIHELTCLAV